MGPHFRTPASVREVSSDKGNLYHSSFSLLLAHEDKSYPGALIASLSIPWGEARGDKDQGGYHLVWTRDMVNSASALLASGESATPLRALIYLAVSQQEDGGFSQNFWVNGNPYWRESNWMRSPSLYCWPCASANRMPFRILTPTLWC
jgi:glucoamylase